ncbi:ABC transporter substrate-binding protein [Kurthia gibsonii]|uniref:ABC transporter substrate-binding protein n=1 Tax=Kurthia gibsonii TaxID=33946 RepID=A0ABU9LNZ8_9BACL|nr:ABC transporter substrate-binding protein [Kurthia gibsonii]
MKRLIILFCTISLIFVLAACSNNKEKDGKASASEEEKTREIDTVMGKVIVPSDPQRVIVDWNLGEVMAVGIEPVGTSKTILDFGVLLKPYVTEKTQDIGVDGQVSMEKILDLKPDLIITYDKEAVEKYKKIAPTVVYDVSQYDTIQEKVIGMGEILNRQEEAKEFNKKLEKKVAAAKERIGKIIPEGKTISIIDVGTTKSTLVVGKTGERGGDTLYELLDMKAPKRVQTDIIDKDGDRLDVSWEKVSDYAGDYIVKISNPDVKNQKLPAIWSTLDAVENGHVVDVDVHSYFMSDAYTAMLQLDDLAGAIEKQIKK